MLDIIFSYDKILEKQGERMKISPDQLIKNAYIGKTIKSFEYGNGNTLGGDPNRAKAIGKIITKAYFGFNDSREDAGLIIHVAGGDDPIFIYSSEEIEISNA